MGKYQTIKGQKNSSEKIGTNEWFTPLEILHEVRCFYKNVEFLDAASSDLAEKYVKADKYFTKEDNSLCRNWNCHGIWLNPPYGFPEIEQFVHKVLFEFYKKESCKEVILLVNANTETAWFQDLAENCNVRIDIRRRLKFWHPHKKSGQNPSGQCLFYLGDRSNNFIDIFGHRGLVYSKPFNAKNEWSSNKFECIIWKA